MAHGGEHDAHDQAHAHAVHDGPDHPAHLLRATREHLVVHAAPRALQGHGFTDHSLTDDSQKESEGDAPRGTADGTRLREALHQWQGTPMKWRASWKNSWSTLPPCASAAPFESTSAYIPKSARATSRNAHTGT